jgi:AcrR family transcriptional regulator
MAEKRAVILKAAREAFLSVGYGGASMEAIAKSAGVSIMTLYRHARTKDDLFQAVVSEACEPQGDSREALAADQILERPLVEIVSFIGTRFLSRLVEPKTLGLLRAVMIENHNFPQLSRLAYEGLIASHGRRFSEFLMGRPEALGVGKKKSEKLSADFFDCLLGTAFLKALLGISVPTVGERKLRAKEAAERLISQLPEYAKS